MHPIQVESGSVLASRTPERAASDLVEWGPERDAAEEFDLVLQHEISVEDLAQRSPGVPVLSDDRPVNEYFLLRRWLHFSR